MATLSKTSFANRPFFARFAGHPVGALVVGRRLYQLLPVRHLPQRHARLRGLQEGAVLHEPGPRQPVLLRAGRVRLLQLLPDQPVVVPRRTERQDRQVPTGPGLHGADVPAVQTVVVELPRVDVGSGRIAVGHVILADTQRRRPHQH